MIIHHIMKNKYLAIGLLIILALAFASLFWRGCHRPPSTVDRPTVTVPAVDNPPVTAPTFPSAPVPTTGNNADMQREIDRYKDRYLHYKAESDRLGERLAALDTALADDLLTCEERLAILRTKLSEMDASAATAGGLIDELNAELSPRRDTGRAETDGYRFRWQIDHLGRLLPGGFVYDIDLKERTVTCPDCPALPKHRRRNLTAFYGYDVDMRRVYALEARRQWQRVSVSGMVGYMGTPFGMVGIGASF